MKVRFLKLNDEYEKNIVNRYTKKRKGDYIGQIGTVIHRSCTPSGVLYDVQFYDGQVWALETNQVQVIGG